MSVVSLIAIAIIILFIGVAIGTQIHFRPTPQVVSVTTTTSMFSTTTTQTLISTLTASNTLTESCTTTFNSIACFTVSGDRGLSSCQFITDAGFTFIRVENDSGTPVKGASITGNYNEPLCPGQEVSTSTRMPLITNASGWAVDHWSLIGNYSYYINNDFKHPVNVFLTYNMSTYLTVRIPSYNFTTFYKPD